MPNKDFVPSDTEGPGPSKIVYLNLQRRLACAANGLLYVLEKGELESFDRREWIYDRLTVTKHLRGITVENGDAYAYTAKPDWVFDPYTANSFEAGLRKSYLDLVERGIEDLGVEFRRQYNASTDACPQHLVFPDRRATRTYLHK